MSSPTPPLRRRPEALVNAGWEVIDELPLDRALGAFTTASVARAAGVTTGSFFHHFPTAATFGDALVRSMAVDESEELDEVIEAIRRLEADNVVELMRAAMVEQWCRHVYDKRRRAELRHEMLVWSANERSLAEPTEDFHTVGDVLGQRLRVREDSVSAIWATLLDSVGRTFVEPFDVGRLSTGLTALFYGLAFRHDVEPDAVDDELFADLVSVLVAALTKPLGSDRRLADLAETLSSNLPVPTEASPQARSGARRRAGTRARIVHATVGLFQDGWEDVTASEIADRAGVSSQTVANAFGGVRTVAAHTFGVHCEAIDAAATRATEANPADPEAVVTAILRELARCAAVDPEPARALVGERVAAAARFGAGAGTGPGDVRTEIDLTTGLLGPLARMDVGGEPATMAECVVNFVLGQVAGDLGDGEFVTGLALRLLHPVATG